MHTLKSTILIRNLFRGCIKARAIGSWDIRRGQEDIIEVS